MTGNLRHGLGVLAVALIALLLALVAGGDVASSLVGLAVLLALVGLYFIARDLLAKPPA